MDINKILRLCTTENMSFIELFEDPHFNKIPKENIKNYINDISIIAKNKAVKLKAENENICLMDICKARGVEINIIDKDYRVMNVQYRAEIYYKKKVINIMKNSITEMYNQLKNLNLCEDQYSITIEDIKDIHIAHELYHLIEYIDGEETGDLLPKVTSLKIGKFEKKSKITRTSEAAAHIFCMEMLELPFHPKLLDYLYLMGIGEITETILVDYLENIQNYSEIL